jgi:hypothetical protein
LGWGRPKPIVFATSNANHIAHRCKPRCSRIACWSCHDMYCYTTQIAARVCLANWPRCQPDLIVSNSKTTQIPSKIIYAPWLCLVQCSVSTRPAEDELTASPKFVHIMISQLPHCPYQTQSPKRHLLIMPQLVIMGSCPSTRVPSSFSSPLRPRSSRVGKSLFLNRAVVSAQARILTRCLMAASRRCV